MKRANRLNKRGRALRVTVVALLLAVMMLPALASATTAYVVTTSGGLNLRDQPSTSGNIVTSFPRGTQVEIYQTLGAWAYVYVQGYYGYMNNSYLSTTYPSNIPANADINPYAVLPQTYNYPQPSIPLTYDGVNYWPTYFNNMQSLYDFLKTVKPSWPYYPYYPYYPLLSLLLMRAAQEQPPARPGVFHLRVQLRNIGGPGQAHIRSGPAVLENCFHGFAGCLAGLASFDCRLLLFAILFRFSLLAPHAG